MMKNGFMVFFLLSLFPFGFCSEQKEQNLMSENKREMRRAVSIVDGSIPSAQLKVQNKAKIRAHFSTHCLDEIKCEKQLLRKRVEDILSLSSIELVIYEPDNQSLDARAMRIAKIVLDKQYMEINKDKQIEAAINRFIVPIAAHENIEQSSMPDLDNDLIPTGNFDFEYRPSSSSKNEKKSTDLHDRRSNVIFAWQEPGFDESEDDCCCAVQ